ncbi:homoserine O-acetyltransferase [Acidovorax sp. 30]|nr:alpha/beta fold hydrolase [Acidovorax sp. 30]PIF20134.1 homoserine O-acetyltransferase [Acidovorax sp. 59]PKW00842.1 homoserine O-acetyltransferase [Acidovorax sp. 30]
MGTGDQDRRDQTGLSMEQDIQIVSIGPYELVSGVVLPDVEVAYVAHGHLAADGGNGILVTHGYTSAPSMLSQGHHTAEGSWAPLLGPGQPLDTDRYFIVCSNMLGSSFGTTGPSSINPETGQPWGQTFPAITLQDIVGVQRRLLQQLGVTHLRAVVGPSYGGWQALQWGLQHPGMVDAVGSIVSGLTHPKGLSAAGQRERFAASPEWRDGDFYAHGGMAQTLFELRIQTLRNYGLERLYEERVPDPTERQALLERQCRAWANRFDPHSMITLAAAAETFDVRQRVHDLQARLLFVVCTTDAIFPPERETEAIVRSMSVPVRYVELESPFGHMASGVEWRRLAPELRWLLN